jgi:hypothetical protein
MRDAVVKAFDINDVEHNIADQLEKDIASLTPSSGDRPSSYAPLAKRPVALPEYVTHLDGVTEIGKLSAEAVIREYEAAAKEIEAMGKEAKRIFHDIESCSAITEEVRTTCDALKKKMGERTAPVT